MLGDNITIENNVISATGGSGTDMNYDYENEINEDEYIDMTNLSVGDTLDTTPISQNDTAYLEVDVMIGDSFQITGLYKLAVVDENNEVLEIQEQSGSEPYTEPFISASNGTMYVTWEDEIQGVKVVKIINGKYIEDNLDLIYGELANHHYEIGQLNLNKQNKLQAKRFIRVNTDVSENDIEAFGRSEENVSSDIVQDEYIDLSGSFGSVVNMSTISFEDTAYVDGVDVLQNTTIKLIGKGVLVVIDDTNTILEKFTFNSNSYYTTTFSGQVVVSWTQTDLYTPYCYVIDTIIDFDYKIDSYASDSKLPTSKAVKNYVDSHSGITNETTGTTSSVTAIWSGTQAEYDLLSSYSSTTLYFIKE